MREILDFISGNKEFIKLLQIKTDNMVSVELEDIRMYVDAVSKWFEFCEGFKGFDKIVARNKIEEYNKAANKSNSEYDQQVAELSAVRNALVTLKTQMNEKEQIIKSHEQAMDDVFYDFITVIDTFECSEQIIKEKGYEQIDEASKSIRRLLNAKKKALAVLEKYSVQQITFPDNHIVDELCITVGTEPDPSRNNGDIISIEKVGYTRKGRVIRPAEVIIVKN